jgi:hypothetical protein
MPAHPVSRLVRLTLAVGTNVILDLGHMRPTVHPVRMVECAELVAADLFTHAEKTRARITFGEVEPGVAPGWEPRRDGRRPDRALRAG